MLRGYQKRVVYLKNTGSEIFKEAYFIMEESKSSNQSTTKELVDEANRIIDENFYEKRQGFVKRAIPYLCFFAGVSISLGAFLIYLLIR